MERLTDVLHAARLNLTPRRTSIYQRTSIMVRLFEAMPKRLTSNEARSVLEVIDMVAFQSHTTYDLHEMPHFKEISKRCHEKIEQDHQNC